MYETIQSYLVYYYVEEKRGRKRPDFLLEGPPIEPSEATISGCLSKKKKKKKGSDSVLLRTRNTFT